MDPELKDFIRVCDKLSEYLSDQENGEIVCILAFVRDEAVHPYGDSDDLAASIAFSNLSSLD